MDWDIESILPKNRLLPEKKDLKFFATRKSFFCLSLFELEIVTCQEAKGIFVLEPWLEKVHFTLEGCIS